MKANLNRLLPRIGLWLAAEIILSLMGLDHLADYSEYLSNDLSSAIALRTTSDAVLVGKVL